MYLYIGILKVRAQWDIGPSSVWGGRPALSFASVVWLGLRMPRHPETQNRKTPNQYTPTPRIPKPVNPKPKIPYNPKPRIPKPVNPKSPKP